ncbi:unnamed protein product [Lactuca virosa]|uniref:DC1 domain-containing protein n=1 Tax=Lactuca virosa TaxID=75947 RepID=A0AAU9N844_9ASTR|nr:unnamed protein product [Lactuca virosa]
MEAVLEVLEHEHPIKLVDLQLHYEEEDDDDADDAKEEEGDDLITKESFRGACDRCGEEINVYHRYYYKCMADSSYDFSLHKFCGELPACLESAFHRHPLTMFMLRYNWSCAICHKKIKKLNMIPDAEYAVILFMIGRIFGFTNVINACTISIWIVQHYVPALAEPTKTTKMLIILILSISHSLMKHTAYRNTCFSKKQEQAIIRCADQSCNGFALHEWCTRLPLEKENHPAHPQHNLYLIYSNDLPFFLGVFECAVCDLPCNGFAYGCVRCKYYVDVTCGLIPKQITHKAHPNHLLSIAQVEVTNTSCLICLNVEEGRGLSFCCNTCNIYIHSKCALLLTETIRHKYDKKHPMHLSYFPIENHKSQYFCEICEEDLNPHQSFYHCQDCIQSIHTACAPLILQSETHTYITNQRSIYEFVNIKFGFTLNLFRLHKHPLLFAQGIKSDGECSWWGCRLGLQYRMIFKCLKCNFVIHYECCERKVNMKFLVSHPHV